jgi:hypothetical protein
LRGGVRAGSRGWGLRLEASAERAIVYPLCRGVRLSKIKGGRLLTGIGGDWGAEDRVRAWRARVGGAEQPLMAA